MAPGQVPPPIPPFPQLEEASAARGLRAVAAEFVPTGGVAATEDQPADACALDPGSFAAAACGAAGTSWWPGPGGDAVWLDDAFGLEGPYLWDYCPGAGAAPWPAGATGPEVLEESSTERESSSPPNPRNYKTAPCWHFGRGRCAMGERCRFAHGPAELRKLDSGVSRGKRQKAPARASGQDPSEDILTMCGAWGALTKRKPGVLESTLLLDVGFYQQPLPRPPATGPSSAATRRLGSRGSRAARPSGRARRTPGPRAPEPSPPARLGARRACSRLCLPSFARPPPRPRPQPPPWVTHRLFHVHGPPSAPATPAGLNAQAMYVSVGSARGQ
ncbi:unnamed protein product [Prorocentrum cordatum]|uniref:C3H1-type domain-containing protein n=1 Tax=Prorocentrum cordatum TaxID=2364126 RepID=A0ABN9X649_9DINO|nr:unnamed protein product [Polarella glacialis]